MLLWKFQMVPPSSHMPAIYPNLCKREIVKDDLHRVSPHNPHNYYRRKSWNWRISFWKELKGVFLLKTGGWGLAWRSGG